MTKLAPIHPGEILQKEFLTPMRISQYRLAKDIGISATRVSEIVRGKRAITAETALRLSLYFGMSKGFWLGLQKRYELDIAEDALRDRLKIEVHPYQEAS